MNAASRSATTLGRSSTLASAPGGRAVADDHDAGHRAKNARLIEPGNAFMIDEQDRHAAVTDRIADLQRVVLVVERHRDQPHPETGEVTDNQLEAVRQEEGDSIPLLEAHGRQPRRQPRGQPLELRRGGPRPVALEDRPIGVDLERRSQELMEHGSRAGRGSKQRCRQAPPSVD